MKINRREYELISEVLSRIECLQINFDPAKGKGLYHALNEKHISSSLVQTGELLDEFLISIGVLKNGKSRGKFGSPMNRWNIRKERVSA